MFYFISAYIAILAFTQSTMAGNLRGTLVVPVSATSAGGYAYGAPVSADYAVAVPNPISTYKSSIVQQPSDNARQNSYRYSVSSASQQYNTAPHQTYNSYSAPLVSGENFDNGQNANQLNTGAFQRSGALKLPQGLYSVPHKTLARNVQNTNDVSGRFSEW